ncbi:MAG: PAC2 family protein [Sulfolobales archaeon]|nr:PAC2 family protein [Sulfolobales archaeon]
MSVSIKLRKSGFEDKVLVVGLPGMGRVGYITANYFVNKLGGSLAGEVYSVYFPSQLEVDDGGFGNLFTGKIYDIGKALVFTADVQPQNSVGQNSISKKVVEALFKRGVRYVVAAAAYVVPNVELVRKVYVVGTDARTVETFTSLGAVKLRGGTISGMNGIIVGWSKYYGIPGAVLLGETWAPLVEVDEADFRAAKHVIQVIARFLDVEVDVSELDTYAEHVEQRVTAALSKILSRKEVPERPGYKDREVM